MLEVERTSKLKLQPTVAVACGKGFADTRCVHRVLVGHLLVVEVEESHSMTVVEVGECIGIESSESVEGGIKHESCRRTPVAVDVLRLCCASTGHWVVSNHRTD